MPIVAVMPAKSSHDPSHTPKAKLHHVQRGDFSQSSIVVLVSCQRQLLFSDFNEPHGHGMPRKNANAVIHAERTVRVTCARSNLVPFCM